MDVKGWGRTFMVYDESGALFQLGFTCALHWYPGAGKHSSAASVLMLGTSIHAICICIVVFCAKSSIWVPA